MYYIIGTKKIYGVNGKFETENDCGMFPLDFMRGMKKQLMAIITIAVCDVCMCSLMLRIVGVFIVGAGNLRHSDIFQNVVQLFAIIDTV